MITVRLHATFRIATPAGMQDRLELELPDGSTVSSVLRKLSLEHDPDHMLLAVNRRMVEETAPLQDGDEVRVMPALSGGSRPSRQMPCRLPLSPPQCAGLALDRG